MTTRRGGYSETLAGGQPGPARAAPPAAYDLATRGSGSCGTCVSGGRPQRGAALAAREIQRRCSWAQVRAVYRACNVPASCRVLYKGRVGLPSNRREPGEPRVPRGTNDERGRREGVGMPSTMLCTVRVQLEGAGGETKPEREGDQGQARAR